KAEVLEKSFRVEPCGVSNVTALCIGDGKDIVRNIMQRLLETFPTSWTQRLIEGKVGLVCDAVLMGSVDDLLVKLENGVFRRPQALRDLIKVRVKPNAEVRALGLNLFEKLKGIHPPGSSKVQISKQKVQGSPQTLNLRLSEINHFHTGKLLRVESKKAIRYAGVRNKFRDCVLVSVSPFVKHRQALDNLVFLLDQQLDLEVLGIFLFGNQVHFFAKYTCFRLVLDVEVFEILLVDLVDLQWIDIAGVLVVVINVDFLYFRQVGPDRDAIVDDFLFRK